MKNRKKIFKSSIILVTLLTFCAAPALQAYSLATKIDQLQKPAGCCCCKNQQEKSACPIDYALKKSRCGCGVQQQLPINSKPLESVPSSPTVDHQTMARIATIDFYLPLSIKTSDLIVSTIASKKHPPLYILNTSLLI